MRLFICLLSFVACLLAPAIAANADVVHSVRFGVGPTALVWGEARQTPLENGPVMTGLLAPVDDVDGVARFKLATNVPYRILAQRADGQPLRAEDLASAGFDLALETVGHNARVSGGAARSQDLGGLVVYASPDRTAAAPGPVETQSLQFLASWKSFELPGGLVFTILAG